MFAFTLPEQSEDMLKYFWDLDARFSTASAFHSACSISPPATSRTRLRKFRSRSLDARRGEMANTVKSPARPTAPTTNPAASTSLQVQGEKGTASSTRSTGTAIAISRALIAILETATAGRSILVPKSPRWVGKDRSAATPLAHHTIYLVGWARRGHRGGRRAGIGAVAFGGITSARTRRCRAVFTEFPVHHRRLRRKTLNVPPRAD